MAENSKIEWCHHTFNPWWGCQKVSEACRNCYAETLSKRTGKKNLWKGERMKTKGPWKDILKWDKSARGRGIRERLFVASMSDIFEDHPALPEWRNEAFDLLEKLTNLDVLLLTKRPKFAFDYLLNRYQYFGQDNMQWDIPKHFWIGTTVENQIMADQRMQDDFLSIPTTVKFLSCEPLLGPINFGDKLKDIDWVIVGGESGPGCRPMNLEWAYHIREQCDATNTAFFMKQLSQNGNWKGYKDFEQFPKEIQVREFPKGI